VPPHCTQHDLLRLLLHQETTAKPDKSRSGTTTLQRWLNAWGAVVPLAVDNGGDLTAGAAGDSCDNPQEQTQHQTGTARGPPTLSLALQLEEEARAPTDGRHMDAASPPPPALLSLLPELAQHVLKHLSRRDKQAFCLACRHANVCALAAVHALVLSHKALAGLRPPEPTHTSSKPSSKLKMVGLVAV
jgi:hypothetical protein